MRIPPARGTAWHGTRSISTGWPSAPSSRSASCGTSSGPRWTDRRATAGGLTFRAPVHYFSLGRLPLSRPAASAQGRSPSGRVERVVDQPAGAHLLPDARRRKAPGDRAVALRADGERRDAGARPAQRMKILRDLFRRRAQLDDLKAEIQAHLEEKIASLIAAGMPRAEAEQAARRAFGNVANIEDAARDVWRMPRVD